MKANVWAAKYHAAEEGSKLWKVLVPKDAQKVKLKSFSLFYD